FVYFILWWTLLFVVLPWGQTMAEEPKLGHTPSAPVLPRLKQKVLATTLLSAIVWGIIGALLKIYAPEYGFFL
ncbi:MAG: DUF1467 family protein, partial [bacterium]|nr:DUF1467 family protein [bacterium]